MNKKTSMLAVALIMAILSALGREVSGTILTEHRSPFQFVNVALYADSAFVAGSISDADGRFSIPTESQSPLTAKISFIGYDNLSIPVPPSGHLGEISLTPAAITLRDVEVKASRPAVTLKGNALVTSVEGTRLSVAGTARDVLARIPMVIDNDGALEVFGKGSPVIYINGRKVNDLQDLEQLNSLDIKSVEVITNPGAAYAADVKSVIRIRTKPPKGDGVSATVRADNGFQHYFRTGNSLDLKYRTRGLELFANYGWWKGHNRFNRLNDMTTATALATYNQSVSTIGKESYNDMTAKLGFSFMFNNSHSIGAFYQNSRNIHHTVGAIPSQVWLNGTLLDQSDSDVDSQSSALPRHYANIYYNGSAGQLNIDFNADYLWYKNRELTLNDERSSLSADRRVITSSTSRNRMFAEKLTLSYPLWYGQIEAGEEYTDTRATNLFSANIPEVDNADNRVDESNIAAFIQIGQQLGRFNIGLGLRYERVRFDYYEMGQLRDDQSKTYNNLFPSLNVATLIGSVRMALSYSGKTVRPGYAQLDGAVSYINRLTYETGNPFLKPTKMQSVEYMAQWRQFFAQASYTYFTDGVYHTTEPFGPEGDAVIIRTANLPHRRYFQAFAGAQFKLGAWQPSVNAGVMKQWLTLPVAGQSMKMNTPGFIFQWQNAIKLPFDFWLNVDAQLMTRAWDNNMRISNTPWHLNAKIYKPLLHNALSITIEAKDIFGSANRDALMYSDAVQIAQKNFSPGRSLMLTLQYRVNTTRDRYRGTGAGAPEKSRL